MKVLKESEWRNRAQAYYAEIHSYTKPARERKSRHEKHPVLDFLHSYYTYSLGSLEKWHPGLEHALEIDGLLPDYYMSQHYSLGSRVSLDTTKITTQQRDYFIYIHNLLALTQTRSPHFRCYGLHEWAMLYRANSQEVRHQEQAPLRLSIKEIADAVESREINCTHFDAYRFFTKAAIPLNKVQPTLAQRPDYEQPACIHANMDLYKWAYKCMPWIGSDLLKQTFLFALEAREIDMRASPYNLSAFGYEAIPVETAEGRAQYVQLQKQLTQKGLALRETLLATIDKILKN